MQLHVSLTDCFFRLEEYGHDYENENYENYEDDNDTIYNQDEDEGDSGDGEEVSDQTVDEEVEETEQEEEDAAETEIEAKLKKETAKNRGKASKASEAPNNEDDDNVGEPGSGTQDEETSEVEQEDFNNRNDEVGGPVETETEGEEISGESETEDETVNEEVEETDSEVEVQSASKANPVNNQKSDSEAEVNEESGDEETSDLDTDTPLPQDNVGDAKLVAKTPIQINQVETENTEGEAEFVNENVTGEETSDATAATAVEDEGTNQQANTAQATSNSAKKEGQVKYKIVSRI